jgi:hypothetical protein
MQRAFCSTQIYSLGNVILKLYFTFWMSNQAIIFKFIHAKIIDL